MGSKQQGNHSFNRRDSLYPDEDVGVSQKNIRDEIIEQLEK
jgi:hypothetical protein